MLAIVFGVVVATFSLMSLASGGRLSADDSAYPAEAAAAFSAATRPATIGTSLIMVAMSLTLAVIGGGLRRYERWALASAVRWSLGALAIVAALAYVNAAVVGPAAATLFASATDPALADMEPVMRWAGLFTALVYAPFPLVLLTQLRKPAIARALDQPARRR